MKQLRVLLAEDHVLVRAGLRLLLQTFPAVEVVGEASNGHDAVRQIQELRPDVALMDIGMPDLNGIEATRRAARAHKATRVVILSVHGAAEYVRQALVAGAAGYVLKSADIGELEAALRAVAEGNRWLSPALSNIAISAFVNESASRTAIPSAVAQLTPRQSEVLQLIAEGNSTREIGRLLKVTIKTVESHRAQLMDRLNIHEVAGLVLYAVRAGLVQAEQ